MANNFFQHQQMTMRWKIEELLKIKNKKFATSTNPLLYTPYSIVAIESPLSLDLYTPRVLLCVV